MKTAEISQLVTELFEMTKQYLEQETVAPLRRTARYAGLSLLAGFLFAVGWLLLVVAELRWVLELLPDTPLWSAAAYGITAVSALLLAALIVWAAGRSQVTP